MCLGRVLIERLPPPPLSNTLRDDPFFHQLQLPPHCGERGLFDPLDWQQLLATNANFDPVCCHQPSPASAHLRLFSSYSFIKVMVICCLVCLVYMLLTQVCGTERAGAGRSTRLPVESLGTCNPPLTSLTSTSVCGEP